MRVFLDWNAESNQWEGDAEWSDGRVVGLILETDEDDTSAAVARAESFLARISRSGADIREAIAQSLLNIYNMYWSRAGGELTAEEFQSRWQMDLIVFKDDGAIDVCYQELDEHEELFGGHGIKVPIRPNGTIGEAGMI